MGSPFESAFLGAQSAIKAAAQRSPGESMLPFSITGQKPSAWKAIDDLIDKCWAETWITRKDFHGCAILKKCKVEQTPLGQEKSEGFVRGDKIPMEEYFDEKIIEGVIYPNGTAWVQKCKDVESGSYGDECGNVYIETFHKSLHQWINLDKQLAVGQSIKYVAKKSIEMRAEEFICIGAKNKHVSIKCGDPGNHTEIVMKPDSIELRVIAGGEMSKIRLDTGQIKRKTVGKFDDKADAKIDVDSPITTYKKKMKIKETLDVDGGGKLVGVSLGGGGTVVLKGEPPSPTQEKKLEMKPNDDAPKPPADSDKSDKELSEQTGTSTQTSTITLEEGLTVIEENKKITDPDNPAIEEEEKLKELEEGKTTITELDDPDEIKKKATELGISTEKTDEEITTEITTIMNDPKLTLEEKKIKISKVTKDKSKEEILKEIDKKITEKIVLITKLEEENKSKVVEKITTITTELKKITTMIEKLKKNPPNEPGEHEKLIKITKTTTGIEEKITETIPPIVDRITEINTIIDEDVPLNYVEETIELMIQLEIVLDDIIELIPEVISDLQDLFKDMTPRYDLQDENCQGDCD